ncbi:MAG: hypothetical protein ACQEP4_02650 [Bacillota bacterium]
MKIRLEKEMETLLISLYRKAIMTQEGIFEEPFALETIPGIWRHL